MKKNNIRKAIENVIAAVIAITAFIIMGLIALVVALWVFYDHTEWRGEFWTAYCGMNPLWAGFESFWIFGFTYFVQRSLLTYLIIEICKRDRRRKRRRLSK